MATVRPSFEEFCALARDGVVVPVMREIVADCLTPVSACAAVESGLGTFLLESVVGGEKWGRYSFVGFDPDYVVRGKGQTLEVTSPTSTETRTMDDPWQGLREILKRYTPSAPSAMPRFWGGAVGYVSYDAVRRFEPTAFHAQSSSGATYDFSFAIGGTLLVFDSLQQTVTVVVPTRIDGDVDLRERYEASLERIDRAIGRVRQPTRLRLLDVPSRHVAADLPRSSFAPAAFRAAVEKAKDYIRAGDIFQVVLSQRFEIDGAGADALDVYRAMRVINPSPYMYFLRFPEVRIAGASPETLVRLENGVAEVRPIAGTRPRGESESDDRRIEEELLADPKEVAEHVMLVDLGRNDLGRVSAAGTVQVTERMVIERYSHVMHIVSNVRGTLASGRDAIDVLRATFPAGTLSGAPKVRAMQIIDELEPVPRGIYGGAVGYIGFDGNLDAGIAIRTVTESDGVYRMQAGAGIVEASDPAAEFDESVNKAKAALAAIAAARSAASAHQP